jgi:hypothetical protein
MGARSRIALIAGIVVVVALVVVLALTFSTKMRRGHSPLTKASPPPGTAEAAPQPPVSPSPSRTYVVVSDVAFARARPDRPVPEEGKSVKELEDMVEDDMPPYFVYGQNVRPQPTGASTPGFAYVALPEGKFGYLPAAHLWEEPPVEPASAARYLCRAAVTPARLLALENSRQVLEIYRGEVLEARARLENEGKWWIKCQFQTGDRPRYGYLHEADLEPLGATSIDESVINLAEIPEKNRLRLYGSPYRGEGRVLSAPERARLARQGFFVEPAALPRAIVVDDMVDLYWYQTNGAYFLTSDFFLHVFHLLFDRMLQNTEEKNLLPAMRKLTAALVSTAETDYSAAKAQGPAIRDALRYNLYYLAVANRLFHPGWRPPASVAADVEATISKIMNPDRPLPSLGNFLGPEGEDYTQYLVRGHYAMSEGLGHYFRGMMWLGRRSFLLRNPGQTLSAILLLGTVERSGQLPRLQQIHDNLTLLVGPVDDYTIWDYRRVAEVVLKTPTPDPGRLGQDADTIVGQFKERANALLPPPRIVSLQTGIGLTQEQRVAATAGFKLMGQRFTQDAYIFGNLTSPSVGDDLNPRNLPSALDVMQVLGSSSARAVQEQAQAQARWRNYESQLKKLQGEVGRGAFERTAYGNWLATLGALFGPARSRQLFARSEPWTYKSLNAALGSWTELKHDTVLYTKQVFAESGGVESFVLPPYPPPSHKGYVEPSPAFFAQILALSDRLVSNLKSADLLSEEYLDKFQTWRTVIGRAQALATREVEQGELNQDDYSWIQSVPHTFDKQFLLPREAGDWIEAEYLQAAVITDAATDAVSARVLTVATGIPQRILVLVKDFWGGTRLTTGYIYSWYEFPSARRWTDKEWKQIVYGEDAEKRMNQEGAALPKWYEKMAQ